MSIRYFYKIYILGIVILSNGLVSQSSNSELDFSQLANLNHGDPIVQAIINEKVSNGSFSQINKAFEARYNESLKEKSSSRASRALSSSIGKDIEEINNLMSDIDEEGNKKETDMPLAKAKLFEILDEKADRLKSYDLVVIYNLLGYIYTTEENFEKALETFEFVIAQPDVTPQVKKNIMGNMAQLYFMDDRIELGLKTLLAWMYELDKINTQTWDVLARVYYQQGFDTPESNKEESLNFYQLALDSALFSVETSYIEGVDPKENSLVILAAMYGELEDRIGKEVALDKKVGVYEILVNLYPKKSHYLNLASTYFQMDRERDYMIILRAAYQKDYLDKQAEYITLAQLLLTFDNPYWAAEVLINGQKKLVPFKDEETGEEKLLPVVKEDEKTLKLLADCLISAQEYEQAIPILLRAAQLSDDGQKYVVLGSLYSQLDQWENAAEAIEKGIKKGNVRNLFQAKLSLGSIFLEMRDFEKAKKEFRFVLKDGEKEDVERANALLRYAESEEYRLKNIAMRRDLIKQNS